MSNASKPNWHSGDRCSSRTTWRVKSALTIDYGLRWIGRRRLRSRRSSQHVLATSDPRPADSGRRFTKGGFGDSNCRFADLPYSVGPRSVRRCKHPKTVLRGLVLTYAQTKRQAVAARRSVQAVTLSIPVGRVGEPGAIFATGSATASTISTAEQQPAYVPRPTNRRTAQWIHTDSARFRANMDLSLQGRLRGPGDRRAYVGNRGTASPPTNRSHPAISRKSSPVWPDLNNLPIAPCSLSVWFPLGVAPVHKCPMPATRVEHGAQILLPSRSWQLVRSALGG